MIRAATEADLPLVRQIITAPSIWPYVSDDGSPRPEEYQPAPGFTYLLVNEGEGVFLYHPHNFICWEVHTCLLPVCRGERATEAARASLAWVFANTNARKVITHVPRPNRLAYRFARRVGLTDEGTNRASFLKDGVVHDQHVLGITREELQCLLPAQSQL